MFIGNVFECLGQEGSKGLLVYTCVHQLQVHRVMNQLALVSRIKDVNLRSQNAEQLRENGWLRCSRKPQSFKTYDSSEFGVHTPKNGTVATAFLLYIIYCTVVLYVFWRASAPT